MELVEASALTGRKLLSDQTGRNSALTLADYRFRHLPISSFLYLGQICFINVVVFLILKNISVGWPWTCFSAQAKP